MYTPNQKIIRVEPNLSVMCSLARYSIHRAECTLLQSSKRKTIYLEKNRMIYSLEQRKYNFFRYHINIQGHLKILNFEFPKYENLFFGNKYFLKKTCQL